MKYIINIIFIGVSGLRKFFLDQSCSPLDAEHIISMYLGMEEMPRADALSLEGAVRKIMDDWDPDGRNMIGLGTDRASSMTGQHHGLESLLCKTWPHVIHISCANHELDLVARAPVKAALPSSVEYILKASSNWFSHSAGRIAEYKKIADLIGMGDEGSAEDDDYNERLLDGNGNRVIKQISPSATRWLVFADCISRLLLQYHALSAHFQVVGVNERCYEAKVLANMYKDEVHCLHMIFLASPLNELKRIGNLFQSNHSNNIKIYKELQTYFMSVGRQLLKPGVMNHNSALSLYDICLDTAFALLPIDLVDLGQHFQKKLEESNIAKEKKRDIRTAPVNFLKELFDGLQKRIKPALILISKTEVFQLPQFLHEKLEASMFSPPFFDQDALSQGELESKAHLIREMSWDTSSMKSFWIEIHNYMDASGRHPFRCISHGVLKILCMPTSNAEVERVFSQVNLIKTHKRTRMQADTLEAMLYCH